MKLYLFLAFTYITSQFLQIETKSIVKDHTNLHDFNTRDKRDIIFNPFNRGDPQSRSSIQSTIGI